MSQSAHKLPSPFDICLFSTSSSNPLSLPFLSCTFQSWAHLSTHQTTKSSKVCCS